MEDQKSERRAVEDKDPDDEGYFACPFCGTLEDCDHMLLIVDKTYRTAEGGKLYDAFNKRWMDLLAEANADEDPDFDEGDLFEELLDEVRAVCDREIDGTVDGAPGMSSSYAYFFCRSAKEMAKAAKEFTGKS
jgi:hypothetical protein